ncbi:hypothetical protein [Caulobacter sp. 17J80-11]|uniref:hypothetical protein n=1 Tax=Caulobacter sp. 17J80-11 TaxID=2763502 RepID=UPI0016536655|nr:hypothetical protein [Caulobacter sp. 17J80-11]MBC6982873.1 hypothetical protein [Caulobacter sp. 17J80-11]
MQFTTIELIEIGLVTTMIVGVAGLVLNRVLTGKGIGVRNIQFVAVATIVPGLILLTMMGKIGGETTAAIFSATVGYLFAQIAKFDERE